MDNDILDLLYLIIHETSHYYVKKIYNKYINFFESKNNDFEKIKNNIVGPYKGLRSYIEESIVRACSLHILNKYNLNLKKMKNI